MALPPKSPPNGPSPPAAPNFSYINKRAAEIAEKDPMLAYAVGRELRKRLVGRTSEVNMHEMLRHLAFTSYNNFLDLEESKGHSRYNEMMLSLVSETIVYAYEILTDKYPHA